MPRKATETEPYVMTPLEMLRVGAALQPYGYPWYGPEHQLWLAMSTELPYEVAFVSNNRSEVEAEIKRLHKASAGKRGRGAKKKSYRLLGPVQAPPHDAAFMDYLYPSDHDDTGGFILEPSSALPEDTTLAQITEIELLVTFTQRNGRPMQATYTPGPRADAIFLSRGAREAFSYPRYLSMFGPEYVAKMRKELKDE